MIRETRICIESPEGTDLVFNPAGLPVRAGAWLVDAALKFVLLLIFALLYFRLGEFGWGVFFIFYFGISWFYPVIFELAWQGQTPGKRYMGLRVLNDDGTPLAFAASLIRNLLRAVDVLPGFYMCGALVSLYAPMFKRIGDLAAGTMVVYQHPASAPVMRVTPSHRAGTRHFSAVEQRVLQQLVERAPGLSAARQEELWALLTPLMAAEGVQNTPQPQPSASKVPPTSMERG